jgi:hypothetical protein
VQIRLVGNQSCVRRFNTSEKVGVLMTLVSQKVPEALQKLFILNNSFPRKVCGCVCLCVHFSAVIHFHILFLLQSLAGDLDTTIEEAGLKNASVMMAWL